MGMLTLASDHPTAADLWFILTYLYVTLATTWTLACWLSLKWLHEKNPCAWKRPRKRQITPEHWRTFTRFKWSGLIVILVLSLSVIAIARSMQVAEWERKEQEKIAEQQEVLRKELAQLKGRLYPGNDPMPEHICGDIKDEEIVLFLGTNAGVTKHFPHTVLRIKDQDRLMVNRGNDGSIAVTLDVFSRDGRIIARIENGEFVINQNNVLESKRRDRHSVEVIDQGGRRVLNMRYLNPKAMVIDAALYYPDVGPVVIEGSRFLYGGLHGTIGHNCSRNVKVDIHLD